MFFKYSISLTPWWRGRQITVLVFEKEIGIKCGAINTKQLDLIDEWLKTLYRSLYLYIILDLTVVIPLCLYVKPGLDDVVQVEKQVPLEDTEDFFVRSQAGSHFYLCQRKKKGETPAFRSLSSKSHAQNSPLFWPRGKKLQHSLNSDVTTRRRGIHFETLVICSFNIHFCICMT